MSTGRRPHEPAVLKLMVARLPNGALRFTTPTTPGWAAVATCPAQVARCIEAAFVEVQLAAYAAWRGVVYDLAEHEEELPPEALRVGQRHPAEPEPPPPCVDEVARQRRVKHPATHDPADWRRLPDGFLRSPAGRRYSPASRQGQAVLAAMRARGAAG